MRVKQILIIVFVVILSGVFGYRFGLSESDNFLKSIVQPGSMVIEASYVIFTDGSTVYARNGLTGEIEFSGTDASTVIQNTINALTNGGKIFIRTGTYFLKNTLILPTVPLELIGESEGNVIFSQTNAYGYQYRQTTLLQTYNAKNGITTFPTYTVYNDEGGSYNVYPIQRIKNIIFSLPYLPHYTDCSVLDLGYQYVELDHVEVKGRVGDVSTGYPYRLKSKNITGIHIYPQVGGAFGVQWGDVKVSDIYYGVNIDFDHVGIDKLQTVACAGASVIFNGAMEAYIDSLRINDPDGGIAYNILNVETPEKHSVWVKNPYTGSSGQIPELRIDKEYIELTTNDGAELPTECVYIDSSIANPDRIPHVLVRTQQYNFNKITGTPIPITNDPTYVKLLQGSTFVYYGNILYYENSGTTTITANQMNISFLHNLASTPTNVQITPKDNLSGRNFWTSYNQTHIILYISSSDTVDHTFDWYAEV